METNLGIIKSLTVVNSFHIIGGMMTEYDMVITDKATDEDIRAKWYTPRRHIKEGDHVRFEYHQELPIYKFKKVKLVNSESI